MDTRAQVRALELLSGVRRLPVKGSLSEEHKAVLLVIGITAEKGKSPKARVGEILQMDAARYLDDLLSFGLIYWDPSRELTPLRGVKIYGLSSHMAALHAFPV